MGAPSPFEVSRHIGNNIAGSFRKVKDENAIDSILSQASQSGNPQELESAIGQILSQVSPERQGAAIKYLEGAYERVQGNQKIQREQDKLGRERAAAQKYGIDADLPAGLQTQIYKDNAKNERINAVNGPSVPSNDGSSTLPISGVGGKNEEQLVQLSGHPDREVAEPAKAQLKKLQEDKKLDFKKDTADRKEQLAFHKESEEYDASLFNHSKTAKLQIETIRDVEKALDSGNIKPSSLANVFKGLGPVADKISSAIINKDQATLQASIPAFLEGRKELFGVRLSDADLKLLQDKLPDIGKNVEANKTILRLMKKYAESSLIRHKIGSEIKEGNKGLRPLGYADKVEKRYDEMIKPVRIINPNNGNIIEIPAFEVGDAINSGASLADG